MMLKTTVGILVIMGILAESRAAAVKPLQGFTAGWPMPGFNMANQMANMFMSAPSGFMSGMNSMTCMSPMTMLPSPGDGVQAATQMIQMPTMTNTFPLTDLTLGLLSSSGKFSISPNCLMNVTLTASESVDGNCNLNVKVTPKVMDMSFDLSNMGLPGASVAQTTSLLNSMRSYFDGFLQLVLPPIVSQFIKTFMMSPDSPVSADDVCRAILNSNIGNLPNLFPGFSV